MDLFLVYYKTQWFLRTEKIENFKFWMLKKIQISGNITIYIYIGLFLEVGLSKMNNNKGRKKVPENFKRP